MRLWREGRGLEPVVVRLHLAARLRQPSRSRRARPTAPSFAPRIGPLAETPLELGPAPHAAGGRLVAAAAGFAFAWTSRVGSALPGAPRGRRQVDNDPSIVNSRRLETSECRAPRFGWQPRRLSRATLAIEVRNVFDSRHDNRVSVDGYPNPIINSFYDDYAAYPQRDRARGRRLLERAPRTSPGKRLGRSRRSAPEAGAAHHGYCGSPCRW